jgi:hypothetical protein
MDGQLIKRHIGNKTPHFAADDRIVTILGTFPIGMGMIGFFVQIFL